MIRLPSGVQPRTRSGAGCQVSRFGTPPEAGTTKTSTLPSYSPVKAMRVPSGENAGSVSLPGSAGEAHGVAAVARHAPQIARVDEHDVCFAQRWLLQQQRLIRRGRY